MGRKIKSLQQAFLSIYYVSVIMWGAWYMDINKTYNPMLLFTFFPEVPLPPNHPYLTALILFLRSNPNVTSVCGLALTPSYLSLQTPWWLYHTDFQRILAHSSTYYLFHLTILRWGHLYVPSSWCSKMADTYLVKWSHGPVCDRLMIQRSWIHVIWYSVLNAVLVYLRSWDW